MLRLNLKSGLAIPVDCPNTSSHCQGLIHTSCKLHSNSDSSEGEASFEILRTKGQIFALCWKQMAGVLFKLEISDCTSWKLQLHKVVTWLNMSGLKMVLELQKRSEILTVFYAWREFPMVLCFCIILQ